MRSWNKLVVILFVTMAAVAGRAEAKVMLAPELSENGNSPGEADTAPTAGDSAAAPSTATETAVPPAAPADQCVPLCRSGYMCYYGRCISACNPPCGAGFECNANAECVSVTPVTPAALPVDHRAALQAEKRAKKQASLETRMKYRQYGRVTLHFNSGLAGTGDNFDMALILYPAIGFKKNFTDVFGINARVGGIFGFVDVPDSSSTNTYDDTETSNDIGYGGVNVDGGVYFGPLGRFYIGPYGWFAYVAFSDNSVEMYNGTMAVYADGTMKGAGLDMGLRFGSREQIDINWRIQSSFNDQWPFAFTVGIAIHLMGQ